MDLVKQINNCVLFEEFHTHNPMVDSFIAYDGMNPALYFSFIYLKYLFQEYENGGIVDDIFIHYFNNNSIRSALFNSKISLIDQFDLYERYLFSVKNFNTTSTTYVYSEPRNTSIIKMKMDNIQLNHVTLGNNQLKNELTHVMSHPVIIQEQKNSKCLICSCTHSREIHGNSCFVLSGNPVGYDFRGDRKIQYATARAIELSQNDFYISLLPKQNKYVDIGSFIQDAEKHIELIKQKQQIYTSNNIPLLKSSICCYNRNINYLLSFVSDKYFVNNQARLFLKL